MIKKEKKIGHRRTQTHTDIEAGRMGSLEARRLGSSKLIVG